jgi:hypothetical protein
MEPLEAVEAGRNEEGENLRTLLRPIKYALVDLLISLSRVLFFWLPGGDMARGQALMVFHFLGGCLIYLFYFLLPKMHPMRMFIFLFFVLVFLQHIALRGCVMTKAEQTLTNNNDTILDPWIKLVGYKPMRETRLVSNVCVVGTMVLTLLMNTILDQIN